jgi:hypothetical protein
MRRFTPLFVVLMLVIAMPAVVLSQDEVKTKPMCKKTVQIDKAVKLKLEKLNLQHKLDNFDLNAKQEKIKEEMMAELMKEEPSRKAIDKLYDDLAAVKGKLYKNKIDHLLEVKKLLPADHWELYLQKHHGSKCSCGESGRCSHCGQKHGSSCCSGHGSCSHMGCGQMEKGHKCGSMKGCGQGGRMMKTGTSCKDVFVKPCVEK